MEWNEPLFREAPGETGRIGVLVLHGWGGSPRSLQEFASRFVDAGYSVALPLLTGHGLSPEAMEHSLWTHWTTDVEKAYIWLADRADRVFVAGLSMGGTLALWVAEQHPEIAGLISINALVRHPLEPFMRLLGRFGIPRWLKPIANDIKLPGVDEKAYAKLPTRSARQLAFLVASVRGRLSLIRCPTVVFSSLNDHVVPVKNQPELFGSIGSTDKKMVKLSECYHVATMDLEKEDVFAESLAFIAAHSSAT
jgi:carboxylesterase